MLIKETEKVVFKHQGDNTEVYVVQNPEDFAVVWGDYIANAWEESYSSLGTALARVAVLIHASEQSEDFCFAQSSAEDFTQAWVKVSEDFVSL